MSSNGGRIQLACECFLARFVTGLPQSTRLASKVLPRKGRVLFDLFRFVNGPVPYGGKESPLKIVFPMSPPLPRVVSFEISGTPVVMDVT